MKSRFRWGVLGTGSIAAKFAAQLARIEHVELYGVASRSKERAEHFARRHGFCRAFAGYESLLDAAELDAVYIATPTRSHLGHCTLALERGKPVLCEKPLALTAQEGERIASIARAQGVFCMEAMWMRFHPLVQRLRGWIRAGELGQIHHLHAELGWVKDPARVEDPELGRGAALDFGVYPISFAHYMLGVPDEVRVSVRRHPSGVDETVSAQLIYPGCTASIAASVQAQLSNSATVAGSRGTAFLSKPLLAPRALSVVESPNGHSLGRRVARAVGPVLAGWRAPSGIGMRGEAEELMRCVRDGRLESEVVSLEATIEVLKCVDVIRSAPAHPS